MPVKKSNWDTAAKKLKKSIPTVVKTRYAPLKDLLGDFMAYRAISDGVVSCHDLKPILNSKVSAAQVTDALKSAF